MTVEIDLRDVVVDMPLFSIGDYKLKQRVAKRMRNQHAEVAHIRALDGITLRLTEGARVGLVGLNGGGKTTLLRVMSGVLPPVAGHARTVGRVASILDGAMGIDVEASGLENIGTRLMVLGESSRSIARMTDEIAEFSGLGDRLHHSVYTYSAGMQARLSFSIATAISPDILLIDEGIGTADIEFATRARERLEDFMGRAGILVLASHSPAFIHQFCDVALWLDHGRIIDHGPADAVMERMQTQLLGGAT